MTPFNGVDYLPKDNVILRHINARKPFQKCKFCIKTTYPARSATLHCVNCETVYCGSCSDKIHTKDENQDHIIRLANSHDDMQLSRQTSARSSLFKSPPPLEQKPASQSSSLGRLLIY